MVGYTQPEIQELEAVLQYTPPRLRRKHLQRLIVLIPGLTRDRLYTYEYVFFRITLFRPDRDGMVLLTGRNILRDLGILLRKVSPGVPLRAAAAGEPVLPIEAVASQCRVKLTTVRRWGLLGLPLCYYVLPNGRHALGVRQSALENFLAARRVRPARSAGRISGEERRTILTRARRLRRSGVPTLSAVVRLLADESGRSASTIRRLLKASEKGTPAAEVAPARRSSLLAESRAELVRRYRQGEAVCALAKHFRRSRSTIYRALHRALVEQMLSLKISYVPGREFAGPRAAEVCLGGGGLFTYPPELAPDSLKAPPGIPPYLRELYSIPLLTREREKALFRKYNYIKCRMAMLQEKIHRAGYRAALLDEFEAHRQAAEQLRRILIRCNLRLVVSIAKRHVGPLANLFELVSEGNVCLIRAVECYDYGRKARFATYASWAVSKHFARVVPETNYRLSTFITGQGKRIATLGDATPDPWEQAESLAHLRAILGRAVAHLTERERTIIASHYGTDGRPARTLKEIGKLFGVTRERIRQIEARALSKLRGLIGPEVLEGLT